MKTKLFLILIFIGIKGYCQDTITNYTSFLDLSNPSCPSGVNFQYFGDTLDIYGTIILKGCGKQVAIINKKNDSIFINTKDITNGLDCEHSIIACFDLKLKTSSSDSFLIFNGTIYNINDNKVNADSIVSFYTIGVNDTLQLELPSNPSTGYSWFWSNKPSIPIVDTFELKFLPDTPILPGGGEKEIWIFKGEKVGTDTVKFQYKRSWETNSTIETRIIIVQVKDTNSSTTIFGLSNDNINVYPNPTEGLLEISVAETTSKKYMVEVYDLNGIKILSKNVSGSTEHLNIDSFKTGEYILTVLQNNNIICRKMIIKR